MKKKVLVAMSGGVDSSVSAYLLQQSGFDVVGVTMCFGVIDMPSDTRAKCCGTNAVEDAKKVCSRLNIPHYVLDFSKQMQETVIDDFVSEYLKGRTPNPCVRCNKYLKFGKLLEYAKTMEFDFLATGHYAKIEEINEEFFLRRPKDRVKDQTYFLYCIDKESLPFIIFPLGDYNKAEVRDIARCVSLPVADKPQSQDICFITGKSYKEFLMQQNNDIQTGDIVDIKGVVLGRHNGIINYTLGQREGLGIAAPKPLYVVGLDVEKNRVIVGDRKDRLKNTLIADEVNRLVDEFPDKVFAKIRYSHQEIPCSVEFQEDGKVKTVFDESQKAVTLGQSIVFYNNDTVCGGGIIQTVEEVGY